MVIRKTLLMSAASILLAVTGMAHAANLPVGGTAFTAVTAAGQTNTTDFDFTLGAGTYLSAIDDVSNFGTSLTGISFVLEKATGNGWVQVGSVATGGTGFPGVLGAGEFYSKSQTGPGSYILAVTQTAGWAQGSTAGNISINPVPLPGAFSLFGAALLGVGAVVRRRRKQNA